MQFADSKHLASADWDGGVLVIEFTSGDRYQYQDVPYGVYEELVGSASKSTFFRRFIKGSFEYSRID